MELKLDTEAVTAIKNHISSLYKDTIEISRREVGIMKEFLTIQEALKFANVSRNTFNNNFIAKGLPIYQVEGKTYVKKSEINDFIEKHRI